MVFYGAVDGIIKFVEKIMNFLTAEVTKHRFLKKKLTENYVLEILHLKLSESNVIIIDLFRNCFEVLLLSNITKTAYHRSYSVLVPRII